MYVCTSDHRDSLYQDVTAATSTVPVTLTMASTSEQIDDDVEVDCEGFQIKTNFYNVGMRLLESYIYDLAIDAFQRGAENGCVCEEI